MKLDYKENETNIIINDKKIQLPGPIWSVFEYQNRVAVTLHPDFGLRNVFCYDESGKLLWIIERAEFFKFGNQGYDGISIGELEVQGKILAHSRGRPFFIDIDTGKITFIPGNFEK